MIEYDLFDSNFKKFLTKKYGRDKKLIDDIYFIYLKYENIDLNNKNNKKEMTKELSVVLKNRSVLEFKRTEEFMKKNLIESKKATLYTISLNLNKKTTKKQYNEVIKDNDKEYNKLMNENYYDLTFNERFDKNNILGLYLMLSVVTNKKSVKTMKKEEIKKTIMKQSNKEKVLIEDKTIININKERISLFTEYGIDEVIFSAILDNRTSIMCKGLNGNIYKVDDVDIPIPIINTHSNCRSQLLPYFKEKEAVSVSISNFNKWKMNYI